MATAFMRRSVEQVQSFAKKYRHRKVLCAMHDDSMCVYQPSHVRALNYMRDMYERICKDTPAMKKTHIVVISATVDNPDLLLATMVPA